MNDETVPAALLTYAGILVLLILLNYMFNWNLIWQILGYGVGFAVVIGLFALAGDLWHDAYINARRKANQ